MKQPKPKIIFRIQDAQVSRQLRAVLAEWCDLHPVHDLKSVDRFCKEHQEPAAIIVELAKAPPASSGRPDATKETQEFLNSVRTRYPAMRRVVIADSDDLSATIHCLHTRTLDSLVHRPFTASHMLAALRSEKAQPAGLGSDDCFAR